MEFSLTNPVDLAAALAAIASFASIYALVSPMFKGDQLETRLKAVSERREELRKRNRAALEKKTLRVKQSGLAYDIVRRLDLQEALRDDGLKDRLTQAGLRGDGPVTMFYFFRAALPIGFGVAAFAYIKLFGAHLNLPPMQQLAAVVVAIAAGYYAPNVYLANAISKRRDAIMRTFPDALDMLLICVESGMSIELALQRVGQEVASSSIELAEELSLTCAELSYLQERRMAYENLGKRTNHPGVKSVATALVQAERYGTPVGQALRVMAKENRELRLSAAERKAAALPAKLTVPMVLFFLPVLFAVVIGPAIIKVTAMMDK